MASSQVAAEMCGTPRASLEIVALAETGAAMIPEVSGSVRQPHQYTPATIAIAKTAMLKLANRRNGV